MCASDRNLKGGKGEGRGAAEARVPRRVRVSATHSVECSVRVCARSARRRHVRGAAHGAWAGGRRLTRARSDRSRKLHGSTAAPRARAGGPPRARITKATRRYGPKSITNASLRRYAWDRVESRNYGRPAYASYYRSSARPPGYTHGAGCTRAVYRPGGRSAVRRPGVRGARARDRAGRAGPGRCRWYRNVLIA